MGIDKKLTQLHEKNEIGFSDLLYYSTLVAPGIMLLKNGGLLSGFWFEGPDQESSTPEEMAYIAESVNRAFKMLDKNWMMHVESIRKPAIGYPDGAFSEPVNILMDAERRMSYEREIEHGHFETKNAIFLTYFPPLIKRSVLGRAWTWFIGVSENEERGYMEKLIQEYEQRVNDFIDILTSSGQMKVRKMTYSSESNTCGLLRALNYVINAKWHQIHVPEIPAYMDTLLASDLLVGEPLIYDNRYLATISVMEYPHESWAGMLQEMSTLPFETRWSNRFIFTDYQELRLKFAMFRRKWSQRTQSFMSQLLQNPRAPLNRDALRMVEDIDNATESVDSGAVAFGHHTSVVLVRSDDKESLDEKARIVVKIFERKGFSARIETYNSMEAMLGSFPGTGRENVRKPFISTLNLANIVPSTTDWAGEEHCSCNQYPQSSPPLLQAAAISSTPFRLNLHDGDVGHTLILGPTGSGKSTLLATIVSQFERYENSQIFVFDKGYSMLPLALAMRSGAHYDLAADDSTLSLCPLASIDTDAEKVAATEWIEVVLGLSGVRLLPVQRNLVTSAIRNLAETTATDPNTGRILAQNERAELRSLTHFMSSVQDKEIQDVLDYYTGDKDAGSLFDGVKNDIEYKKLTVFEMDHIQNMSEKIFVPAFLFLFREIERRISALHDGRNPPSLIVIDEAWLALKDNMFRDKVREWLLTLRKKNCAVVMATQNAGDIVNSPIRDTILDSCRTKILLPNQNARSESMRDLYKQYLGLNDRQIEILSKATPKQQYYFVNNHSRNYRLFDLGLGEIALSFVGASGKEDLSKVRALHREYGMRWTEEWLRSRKLYAAMDELRRLNDNAGQN